MPAARGDVDPLERPSAGGRLRPRRQRERDIRRGDDEALLDPTVLERGAPGRVPHDPGWDPVHDHGAAPVRASRATARDPRSGPRERPGSAIGASPSPRPPSQRDTVQPVAGSSSARGRGSSSKRSSRIVARHARNDPASPARSSSGICTSRTCAMVAPRRLRSLDPRARHTSRPCARLPDRDGAGERSARPRPRRRRRRQGARPDRGRGGRPRRWLYRGTRRAAVPGRRSTLAGPGRPARHRLAGGDLAATRHGVSWDPAGCRRPLGGCSRRLPHSGRGGGCRGPLPGVPATPARPRRRSGEEPAGGARRRPPPGARRPG